MIILKTWNFEYQRTSLLSRFLSDSLKYIMFSFQNSRWVKWLAFQVTKSFDCFWLTLNYSIVLHVWRKLSKVDCTSSEVRSLVQSRALLTDFITECSYNRTQRIFRHINNRCGWLYRCSWMSFAIGIDQSGIISQGTPPHSILLIHKCFFYQDLHLNLIKNHHVLSYLIPNISRLSGKW